MFGVGDTGSVQSYNYLTPYVYDIDNFNQLVTDFLEAKRLVERLFEQ